MEPLDALTEACSVEPSWLCRTVFRLTGSDYLAGSAELLLAKPLRIVLIVVLALLARYLLHRFITRLALRTAEGAVPERLRRRALAAQPALDLPPSERRRQRAETMGSVLRSIVSFAVFTVAALMVLSELGLDVAPLIASAGIAGIALGFGAQNLVKDFLTGVFMLLEDQYGVGDVIDVGEATGSVEAVGLRTTRLRDIDGVVWYVRNGEILRVGNKSQGWARAVVDVPVAYGEDIARVRTLLQRVAEEMSGDADLEDVVLEQPEVWGVEALSPDAVLVRVVVKTAPLEQWRVARELRQRVKAAFDQAGVEVPLSQHTVWLRRDSD
ncbi:MAG: mechanosensitive ion channel family protein [Actinomycetota bacterium]|nr:mechanosensitive ion channel family protein [Acidothermales bacterium]MDQ3432185.1 mechanosensitive ion channel family protein [Actinomycetota bacterium]